MPGPKGRHFIDNLQQVAADLYDYIIEMDNKPFLLDLLLSVRKQCALSPQIWIWGHLCQHYHIHPNNAEAARSILNELCEPIVLLKAMVGFFSTGLWGPGSPNVLLMRALIECLPRYNHKEDGEFLTDKVILRLNELFIAQSHSLIGHINCNTNSTLIDALLKKKFTLTGHEQGNLIVPCFSPKVK